ncbi:MAG: KH domain-containing protein [Lentisphaeria bacterium]|nr:KH domain-containing protein [Lentisphaeria bacterium]
MLRILKKLFAPSASPAARAPVPTEPGEPAGAAEQASGVEGFVDYVVRSLVDTPQSVRVRSEEKDRATLITVTCEKKDIGKVIGRNGKTISAIRALVNGAGGRVGKRINVEVQD